MTCPNVRGDTTQYCTLNCSHDALRPPCPTCGGSHLIYEDGGPHNEARWFTKPCPDCIDGRVSIEQLAAAWRAVHSLPPAHDLRSSGHLLDYLRQVKP